MQFKQSPNYTKGPTQKLGFLLHGTLGKYAGAVEWLTTGNRENPSSAHYVIGKLEGQVTQLVKEEDVAWHGGTVRNPLPHTAPLLKRDIITTKYINPNQYLIGIEFEWFVGDLLTEWQYNCFINILKASGIKNPILLDHHSICDYKTDDLLFAVKEVQRRLATGEATLAKPKHTFTTPLPYGLKSPDVQKLQEILRYEGVLGRGQGAGGSYDLATAQAVKALQVKHNIATISEINTLNGMRVGALTIKYLNKTYGN